MINKFKLIWGALSKKQKIVGSLSVVLLIGAISFFLFKDGSVFGKPALTLSPPAPIEVTNKDEFTIDVTLSNLPKKIYPAASISVGFDNNKLEFTGVKLGTMEIYGDKILDGKDFDIPLWDCNIDVSNKKGKINAMYLDMTAGKFAYNTDGFDKDTKNIVLRLGFKLKDSSQKGDIYNLNIEDAVFATVDSGKKNTSLSKVKNKLKTNDCKIVVQK